MKKNAFLFSLVLFSATLMAQWTDTPAKSYFTSDQVMKAMHPKTGVRP